MVTMLRFTEPNEDMDRLLSSLGGRWRGGIMPMDAYEKDDVYILRFDLPGVSPEAVDITVEGNALTVTAESSVPEEDRVTWLIRERPAGTHRREVRLGDRVDASRIEANFDNGVLTVTIPMLEESRPHRISISPSGSKTSSGATP